MPDYTYTAKDENGQMQAGTINADDVQSAASALEVMGLSPDEILESHVRIRDVREEDVTEQIDETFKERYTESVSFDKPKKQSGPMDWHDVSETELHTVMDTSSNLPPQSPHLQKEDTRQYFPISETLRLYAGWLLAWYFLVYALGSYQISRDLPFRLPYIEAWLPPYSPLILTFALASFLYLLYSTIHKALGGGRLLGLLFIVLGIGTFVLYRVNV